MMMRLYRTVLLICAAAAPAHADRANLPPLPANPIVAAAFGRSTNDCEVARVSVVERVDINRDGKADAIVWDRSQCYRKFGGNFAIVAQVNGQWVRLAHETGRPRWLLQRTNGWPDFEVPDISRGGRCFNLYRLVGTTYVHAYTDENRPEQCHGRGGNAEALSPAPR